MQQYSARSRVNQARSSSGSSWGARASSLRLRHQWLFQHSGGVLHECTTPAKPCRPASWHACREGQLAVALASIHTYQMAVQCLAAHQLRLRGCVIEPQCTTPANTCGPASWHACKALKQLVVAGAHHTYQMAVQCLAAHHDDVQRRRPRPQKNAQFASRTSTTRRRRSRAATSFTRPACGSSRRLRGAMAMRHGPAVARMCGARSAKSKCASSLFV